MKTKLTLRLEDGVIRKGKRIAKRKTSVSNLVSDYFAALKDETSELELPRRTRSMVGVLSGRERSRKRGFIPQVFGKQVPVKVLFDTNVVLDVWLLREPFWHDSASLLAMAEENKIEGLISPTSITTLHYLGKKVFGEEPVRKLIRELLAIFSVGLLDRAVIESGLESEMSDFEDAVLEGLALHNGAECIATRNTRDFLKSRISAKEPIEIIEQNRL